MKYEENQQGIAVIGYNGRFPKSKTEELFWENLSQGRICTGLVPESRWDSKIFERLRLEGSDPIKPWGGFIEEIDKFDALLFKISPKAARNLDPQQRLFLESAWTVLEQAGYGHIEDESRRQTGLFVGSMWHDYAYQLHEQCFMHRKEVGARTMGFTLANQISHALNLTGPSVSVDNACSSSLMAIHLACQSLLTQECEMAIAGGVNLTLHPGKYLYLAQEELLATERVKACFVPEAKGYIPGEGVGSVLLKPLDKALKDKNTIHAVIKGTATNHNGGGPFFKVPSSSGQADLLFKALDRAKKSPDKLNHIEMSAYGAELTDQTELNSLFKVFRKFRDNRHICNLGSLKPNIGHLESAAGISQVIKVLLQMKYRKQVPFLFDQKIVDEFELEDSPFVLNSQLTDWNSGSQPRCAAINSFGAGGANACVIMEETPELQASPTQLDEKKSNQSHLIVLSAREPESLRTYANNLLQFLDSKKKKKSLNLEDVEYTLKVGRTPMQERLALVIDSQKELIDKLKGFLTSSTADCDRFQGSVSKESFPTDNDELEGLSERELATFWVNRDVDWQQLYSQETHKRVPLPTYPFLHESCYWVGHEIAPITGSYDHVLKSPIQNKHNQSNKAKIVDYLKSLVSEEIGLQNVMIKEDKVLADYGLDSVAFRKVQKKLEENAETLPQSLFFKHKTIQEIADFLVIHHPKIIDCLPETECTTEPALANIPQVDKSTQETTSSNPLYKPLIFSKDNLAEEIAIIGLSGRYPNSGSLDEFWHNLAQNRDFISQFPSDRLPKQQIENDLYGFGSFINDVDKFDPLFFEISPKDAVTMDPQERLFLQTAWEVIEDAGYNIEDLQSIEGPVQGKVGVFLGVMWNDFQRYGKVQSSYWSIPNRVSYFLNLKGPSMAVDTACSSSLFAIQLAYESIRRGESKLAIAGGINLTLHPAKFDYLSEKGLGAKKDQIKVFNKEGEGYLPGEGVGAVLIKPLCDAQKDGDHIYAVIKDISTNHGGKSNGFMAPNPNAQAELISGTLQKSGIPARTISYIDVNAVGSSTGDSIELEVLSDIYGQQTKDTRFCALGSLKSSIGHLEAASGISQLTKILLQLKHNTLLPSIQHAAQEFDQSLQNSPFYVSSAAREWKTDSPNDPRRAAISSFGAGGANAHLILEEHQENKKTQLEIDEAGLLFILSARTEQQLIESVKNFCRFIKNEQEIDLEDIAFTLQLGRKAFDERIAIKAIDHRELIERCESYLARKNESPISGVSEGSASCFESLSNDQQSALPNSGMIQSAIEQKRWSELGSAWAKGCTINWTDLYTEIQPNRISLPTYPFEKKSYWITNPTFPDSRVIPGDSHSESQEEDSVIGYLTSKMTGFLGLDYQELLMEKPLLEYGLDSINATKLKYELEEELGLVIPLSLIGKSRHLAEMAEQLDLNPDFYEIKRRIKEYLSGCKFRETNQVDRTETGSGDIHQPFPLTDIQESFLSGKLLGSKTDYVGCHIYLELEESELDISALQAAWQSLVWYHDILHLKILEDGEQQVLQEIPKIEFETHDLRGASEAQISEYLQYVRSRMSHQVYLPDQWPLFEIRISLLNENKSVIHFSIDEWVVDAASLYLLLSQWAELYFDNKLQLPMLDFSFRDYVLASKQKEGSTQFKQDLAYWINRLKHLPPKPTLCWNSQPQLKEGEKCFPRRRYYFSLDTNKRQRLVDTARQLNVSLTTLILTIFTETIFLLSEQRSAFPIVLTVYNRLPVHPQVDMILGPFISTNIFIVEPFADLTLAERATHYQSQLWDDLDHQSVSGIRALRELKKRKIISKSQAIPFVFTSMLNEAGKHTSTPKKSWFDNISYMVTQTPQVYLDHQIVERDGELLSTWDVAEDFFQPGVIQKIFTAFCHNLEQVTTEEYVWQKSSLAHFDTPTIQNFETQDISNFTMNDKQNISGANQPFGLAPLQHAYVVGRSSMIKNGDISGQIYHEFEIDNLDLNRLTHVWNKLIQAHEMLRVVISSDGNQWIQDKVDKYEIEAVDLKGQEDQHAAFLLKKTKQTMIERVFPLDQWPFFELKVTYLSESKAILHFKMDMLIAAGNSIYLVLKQMFYFYQNPELDPSIPEFSYQEYIWALKHHKTTEDHQNSVNYWLKKFETIAPGPQLPVNPQTTEDSPIERKQFKDRITNWCMIEDKAAVLNVDPASVLLTAYGEVLLAWNDNKPLTIVVVDWERPALHPKIDEVVGDFTVLNWLTVEKSEMSFSEKVQRTQRIIDRDKEHKMVSGLDSLHRALRKRKTKENMVFPFVFTNFMPHSELNLPATIINKCGISQTPQVLIDYVYYVENDCLDYHWDTLINEFAEGLVEEAFTGYHRVLEALVDQDEAWERNEFDNLINAHPDNFNAADTLPHSEPLLKDETTERFPLPEAEKQRLLVDLNRTDTSYRESVCLHQLIEDQVEKTPYNIALVFEDQQLTYQQVNRACNQIARSLINNGVGRDHIVGVMMDRSIEMVLALISILKAGGAYLPLDPTYPEERLEFMVSDANVSIILTQEKHESTLPQFNGIRLNLDDEKASFNKEAEDNPNVSMEASNLAYVIFTSGSTGKPKGCLLPHSAICNRIFWMQETYQLTGDDKVLQKTPFTFDVSVWEFFWPLISGAQLVVAKPNGHKDTGYLADLIQNQSITTCHFVPSMLGFFIEEPGIKKCKTLRQVFVSGEALSYQLVKRFMSFSEAKLHNLYGPTEAAVDVTFWECEDRDDKKIPIGKPISNIKLYILDETLNLVPMGEPGELYISGHGLARGYFNRPDLTAERFIANPFGAEGNSKLYKTGDLVRYLEDGNIEYLERLDTQVKLRGFRIELNEIVETLLTHRQVRQAAVLVQDKTTEDPKLVAYLVFRNHEQIPSKEIRSFLKAKLPEYMVPNIVYPMENLPVTHHGKLDNKALPWPIERDGLAPKQEPEPSTHSFQETIEMVSKLFEEKLKIKLINPEEDLFDLGATSLTIVQVSQKIQASLEIEISVDEFLDDPTINGISKYIYQQLSEHQPSPAVTETIVDKQPNSAPLSTVKPVPSVTNTIYLEKDHLLAEEYTKRRCHGTFSSKKVSFLSFSGLLELFKQAFYEDKKKFLYPSAGDLNAVQIYIWIKKNAVESIEEGIFYYDPVEHALYTISENIPGSRGEYLDFYQPLLDESGFYLFFIGQQNAVFPVYNALSASLMILDTGYMTQLILNRQSELDLGLQPVFGIDFEKIRAQFELDSGHTYITCLAGGCIDQQGANLPASTQKELRKHVDQSGKRFDRHFFTHNFDRSMLDPEIKLDLKKFSFLSKEDHIQFKSQTLHLRKFKKGNASIQLPVDEFTKDEYFVRSCQRHYEEKQVPLAQLGQFLSLLGCEKINTEEFYLFPKIADNNAIQVYLYVKEDSVEGLRHGIYKYHPAEHTLTLVNDKISPAIKNSHYPFNRSHFQKSKFCLLFISQPDALNFCAGDDSMLYLYLQSGYMGQVLMDYQAEYNMGICPIGGMKFDKVRDDFKLNDGSILLHSFTCGYFENPYFNQTRLKRKQPGIPAQITQEKQSIKGIAVTGISGRFPQANNVETFWSNLEKGKSSITGFPVDRWQTPPGNQPDIQNDKSSKEWGAFLDQIDCFDADLFKISKSEAQALDPQERLFLEITWECLENAGYTGELLKKSSPKTGVFIGVMWNDYQAVSTESWQKKGIAPNTYLRSSIANRVSHIFDFCGPSVVIDTSCSSAMTAFHMACQSIRNGECQAALVGGINLMAHPYHHSLLKGFNLLSQDNRCQAFSADGSGWIPGEGVGAALIRPLKDAEKYNDSVYGIIKSTAINHCGQTKRYGIPNSTIQAESLKEALYRGDIEPGSISYVESQATGSTIADASEILALSEVFQGSKIELNSIALGSVKPNIGHLESASTMSQFIKVLLQMKHKKIAPTIHSQPLNPLMKIEKSPFFVVDQLYDWEEELPPHQKNKPFRAMINSIGATGSMGHMVLEAYPESAVVEPGTEIQLPVILSAASKDQLDELVSRLYQTLASTTSTNDGDSFVNVAFTLAVGRIQMSNRIAFVAGTLDELIQTLSGYCESHRINNETIIKSSGEPEKNQPVDALSATQAARLWCEGKRINWQSLFPKSAKRVSLPSYPFKQERYWLDSESPSALQEKQSYNQYDPNTDPGSVKQLESFLIQIIAEEAKLNPATLNPKRRLEEYGVNSKLAMRLNLRLQQADFENLSTTLFFEHQTIRDLAGHLQDNCPSKIQLGFNEKNQEKHKLNQETPHNLQTPSEAFQRAGINHSVREDDIAIVGMDGRFPGANNVPEFWDILSSGRDCISEIPPNRWNAEEYYDEDKSQPGKSCSKWGAFIEDVESYDPAFFKMSPKEAALLDPQERLLLECLWKAMEDAGFVRSAKGENVGVFIGCMYQHYPLLQPNQPEGAVLNNSAWSMANRLSYFFNFSGPSLTVDTACSSSLYAIHLACESIKRKESKWAVAGAVNLNLHPIKYLELNQNTLLSSQEKSRAFGEGDGFIPGEGVGIVLLKPLSEAVANGDNIHGVIKGHAVNHGGTSNGLFVPNPKAHIRLIQDVFNKTNIDPETISYVESSANGALWGDAVEFNALKTAYQSYTNRKHFCSIGSLKSNIGHLEAASGISQLVKVLLQMKTKKLAPTINCDPVNPNIIFSESPFNLQTQLESWNRPLLNINGKDQEIPLRAGINSFGAGGANAHLIVEEWRDRNLEAETIKAQEYVFVLSAQDKQQLDRYLEQIVSFVSQTNSNRNSVWNLPSLVDFIYTLQVGRESMQERVAFVVKDYQEVLEKCRMILDVHADISTPELFTGSVSPNQNGLDWLSDEGLLETVQEKVMNQKDLQQIARFWVKGLDITWRELYLEQTPKKVSLPTYPFKKLRCWIDSLPGDDYEQSESTRFVATNGGADKKTLRILKRIALFLGLNMADMNLDLSFESFGFDSIKAVKLKYDLEKNLAVEIPTSVIASSKTIGDIVYYIRELEPIAGPDHPSQKDQLQLDEFLEDKTDIALFTNKEVDQLYLTLLDKMDRGNFEM